MSLRVKDLTATTRFYTAIGCKRNERFSDAIAATRVWSETISFPVQTHEQFASWMSKKIADARATSQVFLGLSVETREDVDAVARAAAANGGKGDVRPPVEMGGLYNRAFEDPDGNLFAVYWIGPNASLWGDRGGARHGGWQAPYAHAEFGAFILAEIERNEALLLGRRTCEIFAGGWPNAPKEDPIARSSTRCRSPSPRGRSAEPSGRTARSSGRTSTRRSRGSSRATGSRTSSAAGTSSSRSSVSGASTGSTCGCTRWRSEPELLVGELLVPPDALRAPRGSRAPASAGAGARRARSRHRPTP